LFSRIFFFFAPLGKIDFHEGRCIVILLYIFQVSLEASSFFALKKTNQKKLYSTEFLPSFVTLFP